MNTNISLIQENLRNPAGVIGTFVILGIVIGYIIYWIYLSLNCKKTHKKKLKKYNCKDYKEIEKSKPVTNINPIKDGLMSDLDLQTIKKIDLILHKLFKKNNMIASYYQDILIKCKYEWSTAIMKSEELKSKFKELLEELDTF